MTNPTPDRLIRLHWRPVYPSLGPAFRVLKLGEVIVGRAFPAMTGTGFRAEVYLPGAKIEPGALPGDTEEEAEVLVEAAVCDWLAAAGLGVGVVLTERAMEKMRERKE